MTLTIKAFQALSLDHIRQVRALETTVMAYDGTKRRAYLSNQYNADPAMPAFFMAYQGSDLVGFLSIYADEPPYGDITVFVDPTRRRQGIATHLLAQAHQVGKTHGIHDWQYMTESVFMDQVPDLANRWHYEPDQAEWILELDLREKEAPVSKQTVSHLYEGLEASVQARLACEADCEALAQINAHAFETDIELGRLYLSQALSDPNSQVWLIAYQDKAVGTLIIDMTSGVDYYFGLAIDPAFQARGIGKEGLAQVLKTRSSDRIQQLQVEVDNLAAIAIYEANGFKKVSQVRYISKVK